MYLEQLFFYVLCALSSFCQKSVFLAFACVSVCLPLCLVCAFPSFLSALLCFVCTVPGFRSFRLYLLIAPLCFVLAEQRNMLELVVVRRWSYLP